MNNKKTVPDNNFFMQDKAAFEEFFQKNYIPITYDMVKGEFEKIAEEYKRDIFTDEYYKKENRNKQSAILYMNSEAYCCFEEVIENVMDTVNQDIADVVIEIGSDITLDNNATEVYFAYTQNLLKRFLDRFYEEELCLLDA